MRGVLLFVFALVVLKASYAQNLTPVARNGALKVENGKLVNAQGTEPQLRGISLSWSLWQGQKYYNAGVINWLASDFKVSILRASMGVEPNGGYLQQPAEQQKLITDVVDEAIKNGIYILIDWHDHHAEDHMNESKDFFKQMAKRYVGVPNVIYEIYNEPAKANWKTVKEYAMQLISVIRKYDKNAVIIVGSPHWDQDVDIAAADPITGFSNIAYSFHFYASDPNHQEALRAKADKAIKLGLPIIVTEWGVGESNGDGEFNLPKTQTWVKWLNDNHLSWANWNITDKHETTAILQAGAPIYGGWTEANLTPAGLFIRELLREAKPL